MTTFGTRDRGRFILRTSRPIHELTVINNFRVKQIDMFIPACRQPCAVHA